VAYELFFFGDIAQLLPFKKEESTIWRSSIYNTVNRYDDLSQPVRQKDQDFIRILNKVVRLGYLDEDVVVFINKRTVLKRSLPVVSCLRLYTTRKEVDKANSKDLEDFDGEGVRIPATDTFVVGTAAKTADRVLTRRETRLCKELVLKLGIPVVMLIRNLNVSLG